MAEDIGRKGPKGTLNLITGDEFSWSFTWAPDGKTPEPFPGGTELFLRFEDGTRWDWVVSGSSASISVPAEQADVIESGAGFWFYHDANVVAFGQVKRWGPR